MGLRLDRHKHKSNYIDILSPATSRNQPGSLFNESLAPGLCALLPRLCADSSWASAPAAGDAAIFEAGGTAGHGIDALGPHIHIYIYIHTGFHVILIYIYTCIYVYTCIYNVILCDIFVFHTCNFTNYAYIYIYVCVDILYHTMYMVYNGVYIEGMYIYIHMYTQMHLFNQDRMPHIIMVNNSSF